MFEQVMVQHAEPGSRAWTTALGAAGEAVLVAVAVIAPMISPQVLPRVHPAFVQMLGYTAPPPPPALREAQAPGQRVVRNFQIVDGRLSEPAAMPARPVAIDEPPLVAGLEGAAGGVEGGVPGGIPGGLSGALLDAIVRRVAPPPPVAAPAAAAPPAQKPAPEIVRVKVGGVVQHGKLLRQVMPVYPPLARQARISGSVNLVGVIGTDGRIRALELSGGHPLLVPAAIEAVRQWVYRPTFLNGDPVEVIAPICVTFTLN